MLLSFVRLFLIGSSSVIKLNHIAEARMSQMINNLPKTIKAVGFFTHLPIDEDDSLLDLEVPVPHPGPMDILIEVKAVSVNPIDTKMRAPTPYNNEPQEKPSILGRDGAGVVVDTGVSVSKFKKGDEVIFTGDSRRDGANAQYVAVDQILAAIKPKTLSFEEAAAMPLTSVTAYEALYDRLLLSEKDKSKSLLIINSSGGVGSVAAQLAKNLGLHVIGTASHNESIQFSRRFGTEHVLDYKGNIPDQLAEIGYARGVDYILVNYDPFPYWETLMRSIKPQGKICVLVDASGPVDIRPLKDKSVTLASEMMSTRIKYDTEDKERHHEILKTISSMLDKGTLKTTLTRVLTPINAENLKEAHLIMEQRTMLGKLVLSGF